MPTPELTQAQERLLRKLPRYLYDADAMPSSLCLASQMKRDGLVDIRGGRRRPWGTRTAAGDRWLAERDAERK